MGRTEGIFAGFLLIAVVLAVLTIVTRGGDQVAPLGPSGVSDYETNAPVGTENVRFTGNANQDLCTCYEQAYAYGSRALEIRSTQYRAGYSACAQRLGQDGANAWTWGWSNGQSRGNAPRSCRGYYATLRGQR